MTGLFSVWTCSPHLSVPFFFKAKGLGQTLVLDSVDTLYICGSSTSVMLPTTAPCFFRWLSRLSLLWTGYLGYPDPSIMLELLTRAEIIFLSFKLNKPSSTSVETLVWTRGKSMERV